MGRGLKFLKFHVGRHVDNHTQGVIMPPYSVSCSFIGHVANITSAQRCFLSQYRCGSRVIPMYGLYWGVSQVPLNIQRNLYYLCNTTNPWLYTATQTTNFIVDTCSISKAQQSSTVKQTEQSVATYVVHINSEVVCASVQESVRKSACKTEALIDCHVASIHKAISLE